jgi:hypothetical protein
MVLIINLFFSFFFVCFESDGLIELYYAQFYTRGRKDILSHRSIMLVITLISFYYYFIIVCIERRRTNLVMNTVCSVME